MSFRQLIAASLLATSVSLVCSANAADQEQWALDCADPVESGRRTIKSTLGGLYLNGADAVQIKNASKTLDGLVTNATYCQVKLQSQIERADQMLIAEWRSLHQWLNRIADTLHISVTDPRENRWRDEYTLFAEIYEFTP